MEANKLIIACVAAVVVSSFGMATDVHGMLTDTSSNAPDPMIEELIKRLNDDKGQDDVLWDLSVGKFGLLKTNPDLARQELVDAIISLIENKSRRSWLAVQALRSLVEVNPDLAKPKLVDKLTPLLKSSEYMERQYTTQTLRFMVMANSDLAKQELVDELTPLLEDTGYSGMTKEETLWALRHMVIANKLLAKQKLVDKLILLIKESGESVAACAIDTLGSVVTADNTLARPEFIAVLTSLLRKSIPGYSILRLDDRTLCAATALGAMVQANKSFAKPDLVAAITPLLSDASDLVRTSAAKTLGIMVQANHDLVDAQELVVARALLSKAGGFNTIELSNCWQGGEELAKAAKTAEDFNKILEVANHWRDVEARAEAAKTLSIIEQVMQERSSSQ